MSRLSALFCLLAANAAWAGSAPVSTSSVEGYFLGTASEAYLPDSLSDAFLKTLKATCASAGPIWMLGREEPVQCTGLKYIEESGNGPAYRLTMSASGSDSRISLFSIRPLSSHRWITRAPTDPERSAVLALLSGTSEYKEAMNPSRSADMVAIDSLTRARTVFIAPWRTEVDAEFGTPNGKYVVISGAAGQYKFSGELTGSLGSLVDVNGDGVPEIHVSENCDGICEFVTSLDPAVAVLVSIAVH